MFWMQVATQRAWVVRAGWQWFRDRRAASCSRPG